MDDPNTVLSSDLKRYKVKKRSLDIKIDEKLLKKNSQTFSEHFNIFMVKIRRKVASFINPENKQNFSQLFNIKNLIFGDEVSISSTFLRTNFSYEQHFNSFF